MIFRLSTNDSVASLSAAAECCFAVPLFKHYTCAPLRRHTLGQNHKKHSIALLGPFVSKKGPNRGIKCQFDILEKNPKGGPFCVKKFSFPILTKLKI